MIDRFSGDYRFLSNFYPCEVEYDGDKFPSTEHAYQAAKTFRPHRGPVLTMTAGQAKRWGRTVPMRPEWEVIKVDVMHKLLEQKFKMGTKLAQKLIDTGNETIIEGNTWGDVFWGQCPVGTGDNILGKLLMKIRLQLQFWEK